MKILLSAVATLFVIGGAAQLLVIGKEVETVHTVSEEIVELEGQLNNLDTTASTTDSKTATSTSVVTPKLEPDPVAESTLPDPGPITEEQTTEPINEAAVRAELIAELQRLEDRLGSLLNEDPIPYIEIRNPSGFVNSEPFELADLAGEKVIMVKFTTYSCHNCQATYPFVNAWYEKYKDEGLEIVAIHTPEFTFEEDINNVQAAMEREGIKFPVVLDNDYATWRAYSNNFWPRIYLIDINGNIVYDHIGEGAYAVTEQVIRQLLAERNAI